MLILTRRPGESVRIGDHVTVTVSSVEGNKVRLGIEAPRDTVVDREEVAHRKDVEDEISRLMSKELLPGEGRLSNRAARPAPPAEKKSGAISNRGMRVRTHFGRKP